MATNLAYFLVRYTGKRACIVDLDLQFGEVVTALRLLCHFRLGAGQRQHGQGASVR